MTVITETTDAADGTSTSYTMAVGDTFQGALGASGDRDWVAITLTAGETYDISLSGDGSPTQLSDTYLRLYNAGGSLIAQNDDGGEGLYSALSFTPTSTGTYYIAAGSFNDLYAGTYEIAATVQGPPPVFTLDEISNQLTNVYWGGSARSHNVGPDGTITVDITNLTAAGQQLARWALEAWSSVSDLEFSEVSSGASITFDDAASGAYSSSVTSGGTILSSTVNVSTSWLASYGTTLGSYSFQTYVHEIGHALGLGHAGNYNGAATYGVDNDYLNDSWQATVMSYFSQTQNTYINASYAFLTTPMAADIIAIQNLYGTAANNTGDTTYGANSNVGGYLGDLFGQLMGEDPTNSQLYNGSTVAMTLVDTGGIDTLDLSPATANQIIDLTPEAASNILGKTGNLVIARGTIIENAIGGSGNDAITGNIANNHIQGGAGQDTLNGGSGKDSLQGDQGADELNGGAGQDRAYYTNSSAAVTIDLGANTASGGDAAGDKFISIERVFGSQFDDTITGDGNANLLSGDQGNDTLNGGGGSDFLRGDQGADELNGGAGQDWAYYENSSAAITVDLGANTASGGDAAGDTFISIERIFGSQFDDAITGNGNANYLRGNLGDDTLNGGGGIDTLRGDQGADELNGGAGQDWAYYTKSSAAVTVDLGANTASGGDAAGDTFISIERVLGSQFDDTITGDGNGNHLRGDLGNDTLNGGGGNDFLRGDQGADELNGGAGQDWAYYKNSNAAVTIDLGANTGSGGYAAGDTFISIERIFGSQFDDTITGDGNANYLRGYLGDDTLSGGSGNDTLRGDAGADVFVFAANDGADTIHDFEDGIDLIEIVGGSFGALTFSESADGAIIDYGSGMITLSGIDPSFLT